jgi:staphylococcal nuclease domain-containing protein 1
MLASGGGMERLRAAEKVAKEKRLYLYANLPSAASGGKSNSPGSNGQSQIFDATVVRIWSGDQISVVGKDGALERRLQLSSTRGPKYVSTAFKLSAPFLHSNNLGSLTPDKPFTHRKLENF